MCIELDISTSLFRFSIFICMFSRAFLFFTFLFFATSFLIIAFIYLYLYDLQKISTWQHLVQGQEACALGRAHCRAT